MSIIEGHRNAEFGSPTQERPSAGAQQFFQCLETDATGRLLQDERIV